MSLAGVSVSVLGLKVRAAEGETSSKKIKISEVRWKSVL